MKDRPKAELLIKCDCGCEILKIEKWEDDWGIFSLSFFTRPHRHSIWWNIKLAWRALMGEEPYNDQMIIDKEDMENLKKFLSDIEAFKEAI